MQMRAHIALHFWSGGASFELAYTRGTEGRIYGVEFRPLQWALARTKMAVYFGPFGAYVVQS